MQLKFQLRAIVQIGGDDLPVPSVFGHERIRLFRNGDPGHAIPDVLEILQYNGNI